MKFHVSFVQVVAKRPKFFEEKVLEERIIQASDEDGAYTIANKAAYEEKKLLPTTKFWIHPVHPVQQCPFCLEEK